MFIVAFTWNDSKNGLDNRICMDLDSIIPQFYTESIDCFIIGTNGTKRVCWTYETPPNDIKSIRSLSRDFALLNKDPLESFWSRLI